MDIKSASKTLILALAGASFALTALAAPQWQWIDKDGHKVFSDRAPPPEIPAKNILKQPGINKAPAAVSVSASAPEAASAGSSAPAAAKASAPKLPSKDAGLETAKKKAEEEAAAQKKAEEDKREKALAENCELAKKGMATMKSGVRVATTNAKGEREFLDDAARAAETKRIQGVIDSDCKK